MGREAKARAERREQRAAALAKVLPLERIAARLEAQRPYRPVYLGAPVQTDANTPGIVGFTAASPPATERDPLVDGYAREMQAMAARYLVEHGATAEQAVEAAVTIVPEPPVTEPPRAEDGWVFADGQ